MIEGSFAGLSPEWGGCGKHGIGGRRYGAPRAGVAAHGQRRLQRAGGTEQGRVGRVDDVGRDIGQIGGESSLGLEAPAEVGSGEKSTESGHDAAADIHPAAGAEGQREIARHGAEHRAEGMQGLDADRAAGGEPAGADLGTAEFSRRFARQCADRIVQCNQAGARQHALGRHVSIAFGKEGDDPRFACVGRGQGDVTAFAGKRHVVGAARYQTGDAQSGAGPHQADRMTRERTATTDLRAFVHLQLLQRQGERGEVVDHEQPFQAEAGAQRLDRECPVVIGHRHMVAGDRGGDAERGKRRHRKPFEREIAADGLLRTVVVGAGQGADMGRLGTGCGHDREAGIGAADVADQARIVFSASFRVSRRHGRAPDPVE